jgi:hypothetical protein
MFTVHLPMSQATCVEAARATRLPLERLDQADLAFVLGVWQSKRRGGLMAPPRAAFGLADLKPALSHIMIIDVREDPRDFVYRLAGAETSHLLGLELTGRSLHQVGGPSWSELLWSDLCELVETATPQLAKVQFCTAEGLRRDYRELRLPLSADGRQIDKILVMQDCTVVSRGGVSAMAWHMSAPAHA